MRLRLTLAAILSLITVAAFAKAGFFIVGAGIVLPPAVPYTGFNSWYATHLTVSQTYMQAVSDYIASPTSGLQAAWGGIVVAGVDEGWPALSTNTVVRDGSNHPTADANFTSMPTLVSHIKANGQVPLMYRDAGQVGCQNEDWGAGTLNSDVTFFIQTWGFQGLKYDGCGIGAAGSGRDIYTAQKTLLDGLGVPYLDMFGYSFVSGGGSYSGYTQAVFYGPRAGSAWRHTQDIGGSVTTCQTSFDNNGAGGPQSVMNNIWAYSHHPGTVMQYHFADLDYLMANNNGVGGNLSTDEAVTQMAFAAMAGSPWVLGCDPRNLGTTELATLKNADLIAILKDPWVYGARRVFGEDPNGYGLNPSDEHFCKTLSGTGKRAIMVINENSAAAGAQSITVDPARCGLNTAVAYTWKNVLTGATTSGQTGTFSSGSIPSHGSGIFLITGGTENNLNCYGVNPGGSGQVADGYPGGCSFGADNNGSVAGAFSNDGTTVSTVSAITTTGLTNPAAQGCYQQQRKGQVRDDPHEAGIEYLADNLVAGATYHYRIHLAEIEGNASGARKFNLTINTGAQSVAALSSEDIAADAGGVNIAIIKEGNVVADHGYLSFDFEPLTPLTGVPTTGCIEVIKQ